MTWYKGIVVKEEGDAVYLSIPFTWLLPQAQEIIDSKPNKYFIVGGPAVKLMPEYLCHCDTAKDWPEALSYHNSQATFTTRGCIRKCSFCAVPKIEGEFIELQDWQPKPIVCDNNILASSRKHFDEVIDRLKPIKGIDFNQGLDARLLTDYHLERLRELDISYLRFAWDNASEEAPVMRAIETSLACGFKKKAIRIYVLVNHGESYSEALYRCETLKCMGILPNVMRYQPLNSLKKNSYLSPEWDAQQLSDFCRYWNRLNWLGHIPWSEYKGRQEVK